MDNKILATLNI